MSLVKILLPSTFVFALALLFAQGVRANPASVSSTVKVSICGDGLVESPAEDCEGLDLNDQSCASIGFLGGELECDISCSFDTSACIGTPPPTPTPSANPAQPASTGSTASNSSGEVTQEISRSTNTFLTAPLEYLQNLLPALPEKLSYLDLNENGIIEEEEVANSVRRWIAAWRGDLSQDCDINGDQTCNLIDFSIIMYYVE